MQNVVCVACIVAEWSRVLIRLKPFRVDGPEFKSRRRLLWGWQTKLKPYSLLQHMTINSHEPSIGWVQPHIRARPNCYIAGPRQVSVQPQGKKPGGRQKTKNM